VLIDGFDLRNASSAIVDSDSTATFDSAQVSHCIIHDSSTAGSSKGVRMTAITNALIEFNNIFSVADDGIEFGAAAAGASTGSSANFNEVHDLGAGGISNSAIYAFAVGSTATNLNITIQGNLVYNHFGNDAIKLGAKNGQDTTVSGGLIKDNLVHDVAQDGITVDTSNTTVSGNEIYNSMSSNAALFVERGTGVTLVNNYVHDNSAGLAAIAIGNGALAATGITANFNSIVNNTTNTILFRDVTNGTATLDASANWYGTNKFTVVSADVISKAGSNPTSGVLDFTPYLNSGTDTAPAQPGFQPDLSALDIVPPAQSFQSGPVGAIQEAIELTTAGGTLTIPAAAFSEDVNLDRAIKVVLTSPGVTGARLLTVSHESTLTGEGNFPAGATQTAVTDGTLAPPACSA
jgi:hypothetical protein